MKERFFRAVPTLQSERLILRRLTQADAEALDRLAHSDIVYRYLPTFLYEQKYPDIHRVIDGLYDECLRESLILGIFLKEDETFCGLAEMYAFRDKIHKISIGYRLMEQYWGRGIASETVALMTGYLFHEAGIKIITASTMIENKASARVLMKNGFSLVHISIDEDWGYDEPTATDKWFLLSAAEFFTKPGTLPGTKKQRCDLRKQNGKRRASEIREKLESSLTAENILLKAMKVPGVRIDRDRFLRKELSLFFPEDTVGRAIAFNPAAAGIPKEKISGIAQGLINREANQVTGFSVLASLPGSALPAAVAGAVTADIVAYFSHVLRVIQELAYLYGFEDFGLNEEDPDEQGIDPDKMDQIMVFLGVMFGIRGSGPVLEKLAGFMAKHTAKKLVKHTLKKSVVIPGTEKIIAGIGIKLTKQMLADAVASAIPVAGSVVSGLLMYTLFKPRCMKLKRKLKDCPLCDPGSYTAGDLS